MPSTVHFIKLIGLVVGLVVLAMVLLATFGEPNTREMREAIPQDRIENAGR